MQMRTRMAPSPTGELHVGHIRTFIYDYALSKKSGGSFILRIEDTDRNRYVEGSVDRLMSTIRAYGIDWDEGPDKGGKDAPYTQSERVSIYKKYVEKLLSEGKVYRCFCSVDRLQEIRESQQAEGLPTTKYDKHCSHLSDEEIQDNLNKNIPHTIRLRVPLEGIVKVQDTVLGEIEVDVKDLDDIILVKSDGIPLYHFASVVDDHLMEITHILRGSDWLSTAAYQFILYDMFGWEPPKYVHLPLLKEVEGTKKLSKRFGAVAAIDFLKDGYLSEALLNFLMFLGWNPGTEKEIYTLEEFVNDFTIERVQKNALVSFDRQKLLWMNGHYIRSMDSQDLLSRIDSWRKEFDVSSIDNSFDTSFRISVLDLVKDRMKTLADYSVLTEYFYTFSKTNTPELSEFTSDEKRAIEILSNFHALYASMEDWNADLINQKSHEILETYGYKPKEAFMTLRLAITGQKATPQVFDILNLLGRDETQRRLETYLN